MLKISECAKRFLAENEDVRDFESFVYQGKKFSLVNCLKAILGGKDGELDLDEEGCLILYDGKRKFTLRSFFYDIEFDIVINLINSEDNYVCHYNFMEDDRYIARVDIMKDYYGEVLKTFKNPISLEEARLIEEPNEKNTELLCEIESAMSMMKKLRNIGKRRISSKDIAEADKKQRVTTTEEGGIRGLIKKIMNKLIEDKGEDYV